MSFPNEKTDDSPRLTQFFNCSSGALLLGLATTLCIGNIVSAGLVMPHEPVFGLSICALLWVFCGMAAIIAFLCLFWNQRGFPMTWVALLATESVLYWLGLIFCGSRKPAVYLGSVPHVWGVSINTTGIVFAVVFVYLLLGSYALMICSWLRARRNKPASHIKMECPTCRNRFEFPIGAIGRSTQCPHCAANVILTQPIGKPSPV